jgi:hypothetical protein
VHVFIEALPDGLDVRADGGHVRWRRRSRALTTTETPSDQYSTMLPAAECALRVLERSLRLVNCNGCQSVIPVSRLEVQLLGLGGTKLSLSSCEVAVQCQWTLDGRFPSRAAHSAYQCATFNRKFRQLKAPKARSPVPGIRRSLHFKLLY